MRSICNGRAQNFIAERAHFRNDKIFLDYTIKAECEDEMQLLLILDIFDQDLVMIDTFEEYFILQNNEIL
ncbi:MAG: hypothetical protein CMA20_01155 [Euryarchaeota archaeon]|nr:hypothetical protein [Euryarchaeota archaeon]